MRNINVTPNFSIRPSRKLKTIFLQIFIKNLLLEDYPNIWSNITPRLSLCLFSIGRCRFSCTSYNLKKIKILTLFCYFCLIIMSVTKQKSKLKPVKGTMVAVPFFGGWPFIVFNVIIRVLWMSNESRIFIFCSVLKTDNINDTFKKEYSLMFFLFLLSIVKRPDIHVYMKIRKN